MGLLSKILNSFGKEFKSDKKSLYIFYKIVDSVNESEEFTIQCINTSAIFNASIMDVVFDVDILHGLHPIQACYVGIEYSKCLKKGVAHFKFQEKMGNKKYSAFRYGSYQLCHQDRKGRVCFINPYTDETFTMDPRDIAFTETIIKEFDAAQAFHIGVFAGIKLNNFASSIKLNLLSKNNNQSHLWLVKNEEH